MYVCMYFAESLMSGGGGVFHTVHPLTLLDWLTVSLLPVKGLERAFFVGNDVITQAPIFGQATVAINHLNMTSETVVYLLLSYAYVEKKYHKINEQEPPII